MKITYNFNDESVEIDVPEEWGQMVIQFNREEDTQDRNKRRHCYSLDTKVYEGRNMPAEVVRFLCGQDAAGYAENVNLYAAGNGLKAITRGSAQNEEVLKLLNLCPERYSLVLAQSVGK